MLGSDGTTMMMGIAMELFGEGTTVMAEKQWSCLEGPRFQKIEKKGPKSTHYPTTK
jgi:hypothetical protein